MTSFHEVVSHANLGRIVKRALIAGSAAPSTIDLEAADRRSHSDHAPLRCAAPATAAASPIDGSLVAIERSYDDAGRLHSVRSRSSDSGNPVVNEVEFAYTPLWQVERLWQTPPMRSPTTAAETRPAIPAW